jgi:hypothetical protein
MSVQCLNYSAGKKVTRTGGGRRGSVYFILWILEQKGGKDSRKSNSFAEMAFGIGAFSTVEAKTAVAQKG